MSNTPDNALAYGNEFHCLLGKYFLFWSTFSQTIDFLICKFQEHSEESLYYIAKKAQSTKIEKIKLLVREFNGDNSVQFCFLVEKILEQETRNLITHGYIESDIRFVEFSLRRQRDPHSKVVRRFSISEFRQLVADVIFYGHQLNELMKISAEEMDLFVERYRDFMPHSDG